MLPVGTLTGSQNLPRQWTDITVASNLRPLPLLRYHASYTHKVLTFKRARICEEQVFLFWIQKSILKDHKMPFTMHLSVVIRLFLGEKVHLTGNNVGQDFIY